MKSIFTFETNVCLMTLGVCRRRPARLFPAATIGAGVAFKGD
jgi:hypothetical protein